MLTGAIHCHKMINYIQHNAEPANGHACQHLE